MGVEVVTEDVLGRSEECRVLAYGRANGRSGPGAV